MALTCELVRRFELHQADAVQSLLTHSLKVPGNPDGYALYHDGPIRAVLSTNPRASWATQAYGATGQPPDALARVVVFFNAQGVPERISIGRSVDIADVTRSPWDQQRVNRGWAPTEGRAPAGRTAARTRTPTCCGCESRC